jgi:hypothetical protein
LGRTESICRSRGITPFILNVDLNVGEGLASCPHRFIPRERSLGTHWTGGWTDPRANMDNGEDKSLWPMVRIEQFIGRQVRCIVTIHSELTQFFVRFTDNVVIISPHTASKNNATMNYYICASKYHWSIFSTISYLFGGTEKTTINLFALSSLPFDIWAVDSSKVKHYHYPSQHKVPSAENLLLSRQ